MKKLTTILLLAAALLIPVAADAAEPKYPDSALPITKYGNAELCQSMYTAIYHNHAQTLLDLVAELKKRPDLAPDACRAIARMHEDHFARLNRQREARRHALSELVARMNMNSPRNQQASSKSMTCKPHPVRNVINCTED